jgi:PIN domain nuclease of toxin-antitoxin system
MVEKSASSSTSLLLDTHILLWLSVGDSRLSEASLDYIEKAARRREIRVSVISLWEIGFLLSKKKIELYTDINSYWQLTTERLLAKNIEISSDDIFQYHSLPEHFHGDPGDRFIVSQAMTRKMRLLTADTKLTQLAKDLLPATIIPLDSL